ncbi:MAG: nucleoside deaminase [Armatimonadetes bacterium]|jgi:tRNA(Arg) A34 adenosine deaminase TadA|nr:nucleoside deaminase [Armatimonadota bacterium]
MKQTDEEQMSGLVAFASQQTNPFGARIVRTATGEVLIEVANRVSEDIDPSAHAELRAVRLACQKLESLSLAGYTLYTTCEPCPMCMASALWARLDRVVYGATIDDAAKHCSQIYVFAQELTQRSDFTTVVHGPCLRPECYALFTRLMPA